MHVTKTRMLLTVEWKTKVKNYDLFNVKMMFNFADPKKLLPCGHKTQISQRNNVRIFHYKRTLYVLVKISTLLFEIDTLNVSTVCLEESHERAHKYPLLATVLEILF